MDTWQEEQIKRMQVCRPFSTSICRRVSCTLRLSRAFVLSVICPVQLEGLHVKPMIGTS